MKFLRRALPYLTFAVIVAVAYDGWIFYSRWSAAREAQRAEAQEQAEDARRLWKFWEAIASRF